ncbi:uncharacterized protein MONOS_1530 [Monocercomonoides exilis]|uniref:uncharacterized protein n=1 Tax=Monocercomonoides exilis TaxID=2049356 RepID=UPI00355A66C8|nr:hypothetical protein MONOS_1530 [Monocercomonoides exilis]|eukprot:MONOS_1530.1-p1 / transcript=MONOS_1530.1 / gene=MONOS_1530 / organism=Monocercomonoides_exilis_PA203 / gene_product=unspecified product / transcript_product=unspecified product / location=Mono_scaffold00027:83195-83914(-) / protein_length=240 / sequence_SO=supercontig / SO=protein_coding / is_pseudo=false
MFSDNLCYLVAIGLNNRYLFVEPTNFSSKDESSSGKVTHSQRSASAVVEALNRMILKGMKVKYLRGDSERAFNSTLAHKYFKTHNISFQSLVSTGSSHTQMAPLDRVVRTIRDMNYTSNPHSEFINPVRMKQLVYYYNNAPHYSLSKIMNFDISPQQVYDNEELENEIIRRMHQLNYNIINSLDYKLPMNTIVILKAYYERLDKRRMKILPETFIVIGYDKGKIRVKSNVDNRILLVSR